MITIEDIKQEQREREVIRNMMNHVNSEAAKEAIRTADDLSDIILFHARVRENAKSMMKVWDDF